MRISRDFTTGMDNIDERCGMYVFLLLDDMVHQPGLDKYLQILADFQ